MYPHIIKDTFIQCVKVQAPEGFILSVEFISVCDNFTITWQFNDKNITDNKYMTNATTIKDFHYKISLRILQSNKSDTGNYTVTVASPTGSDSVNISVKVISKL